MDIFKLKYLLWYFKTIIKFNVPANEDGTAKYIFTTNKPDNANITGSVYLVTDNNTIILSTENWTYHTSLKYKEKNGTKEPSYKDYIEWMNDEDSTIKLTGLENIKINNREAIRYYNREGSSNNYKYYGYNYIISLDDINKKQRLNMTVNYNDEELPTEIKELNKETLSIINSLNITENNN